MNGYANLIAARLRKLADEGSTGTLPVSGRGDGAIFFRDGQVVYAESSRTSLPAPRETGLGAPALTPRPARGSRRAPHSTGTDLVAARSVSRLVGMLELTELIIDALTELLSSESRYAKFRHAQVLPVGQGRPMPVETLLAEVQRRHEVQRQLATVVTPDTTVACEPSLDPPTAQVSSAQWALLTRAGEPATPRELAMQLGRSVFGTTIEVHRLVALGLLVVSVHPPELADGRADGRSDGRSDGRADRRSDGRADGRAGHGAGTTLSFIRAVSGERGSDA